MSDFEEVGCEATLGPIIDRFVDRCFDDPMIGFFFARADRERTKRFEYQHAAAFLGADVSYQGRPLRIAHGAHRIMGGQFARRLTILREVLEEAALPAELIARWMAHQESLRGEITGDPDSDCDFERAKLPLD